MSGPQFDQFGNKQDGDGIKALRKAVKEKAKENKELLERITALEAQSRSGSVADTLGQQGLDPRVAKFYPGDRATTADAVAQWVDENRDLFAGRQDPNNNSGGPTTTLTADEVEGFDIMRKVSAARASVEMDATSKIRNANTEEELMATLAELDNLPLNVFG